MKKFLTITVTTILLWAISTYIISTQTQQEFQHYIDRSNQLSQTNGFKLILSDYQPSFLNSIAIVQIDFIDPIVQKELEKEYILPIKIKYNIEHGPLFFKDGFGVGLSKLHNEFTINSMLKPKAKKELLALVKKDINFNTTMILSFDKKLHYTIESDPISIDQEHEIFEITPLKLKGTVDIKTLQGNNHFAIDKIQFKKKNSPDSLYLKDFELDINIHEFVNNTLLFGDFQLSIANLNVHDQFNPFVKNINLSLKSRMRTKRSSDKTMNSDFELDIDLQNTTLPKQFETIKNLKLTMNMKDLGIEGMFQFQQSAQQAQEEQSQLLNDLQTSSPENMQALVKQFEIIQNKMINSIVDSLNTLLIKDKSSINYRLDMESKENVSSHVQLEVGYRGNIKFEGKVEALIAKIQSEILSLIKLNLQIKLNKKHIKMIPIPLFKEQLKIGVREGFVKENNTTYMLNGYYNNKELIINDNNLTATILPLIIMLTAE